jgi:small subunit ribosomal protein S6
MRNYDVVLIVHPDLDEAAFTGVVEKVKGWVSDNGGTVDKLDVWGKRTLTYTIRKQREGQYAILTVQMAPTYTAELERNLRFLEPVMRFLITTVD